MVAQRVYIFYLGALLHSAAVYSKIEPCSNRGSFLDQQNDLSLFLDGTSLPEAAE